MGALCSALPLCSKNIDESLLVKRKAELLILKKYRNSIDEMTKLYNITDTVLGVGSYGKVVLAESKINKNYQFAMKIMSKELMTAEETKNFKEICD